MYRKFLHTVAAAILLINAGCATRSTVVLRHALNGTVCCADFAGMRFTPLTTDESDLSIGAGSPVFTFPEGNSFFAAYRLPEGKAPGLVFRSYLTTDFLPDTSVFIPSFVFLDASKKPINTVREVPMRSGGGNFWLGPFFTGQVAVPDAAVFVVVYAIDNGQHQALTTRSENGKVWPVPPSLSGTLKIAVSR